MTEDNGGFFGGMGNRAATRLWPSNGVAISVARSGGQWRISGVVDSSAVEAASTASIVDASAECMLFSG